MNGCITIATIKEGQKEQEKATEVDHNLCQYLVCLRYTTMQFGSNPAFVVV
jgi:hypothetical protein